MAIPLLFKAQLKTSSVIVPQVPLNKLDLDLAIEKQKHELWCWAAVGVAVAHYYTPSSPETQCSLAATVKNVSSCCNSSGNVNACMDTAVTDDAIKAINHYSARNMQQLPKFIEAVDAEYENEKPLVCIVHQWRLGGQNVASHALIVRGQAVINGVNHVRYLDPWVPYIDMKESKAFESQVSRFILTD